jgi:hypothetical protein
VFCHLLSTGAALAALAMTAGSATAASATPGLTPPKAYYLALGDSIAYGFQTSKALAGLPPDAFNTGYADLFAARLRQLRPRIATINYACPGESTTPSPAFPRPFPYDDRRRPVGRGQAAANAAAGRDAASTGGARPRVGPVPRGTDRAVAGYHDSGQP